MIKVVVGMVEFLNNLIKNQKIMRKKSMNVEKQISVKSVTKKTSTISLMGQLGTITNPHQL